MELTSSEPIATCARILDGCDIAETQAIYRLVGDRLDALSGTAASTAMRTSTHGNHGSIVAGGKPWMTIREVAQLLRCRPEVIRRAIEDGQLRARRSPTGRGLFIAMKELERWVEEDLMYIPSSEMQRATAAAGSRSSVRAVRCTSAITFTSELSPS